VAPRFYDRDAAGVPTRWVKMMRHAVKSLGPEVLSSRMLRDYVQQLYRPAAVASRTMSRDGYAAARTLAEWRARVVKHWNAVRVGHVESTGVGDTPQLGNLLQLRAEVELGVLSPDDVVVQACAGRPVNGSRDDVLTNVTTYPMRYVGDGEGTYRFAVDLPLDRAGAFGYTVRVLPHHELLESPVELGLVTYP
jgi:starch phosphorylase